MKKILFPILFLIAACDSIEDPECFCDDTPLSAPNEVTITEATPNSLSFSWSNVVGAVQYGYTLCDMFDTNILGGTTNDTELTLSGLSLFTNYIFKLTAMPAVGDGFISETVEINAKTPFYECVEDEEGVYTSYLLNSLGKSYSAILNEDRTTSDYKEGWFGVFTLSRFYEYDGGELVFTVNKDGSISIKNAIDYIDEDGVNWALVTTGIKMPASRKQVYIDESTSSFDITTTTLSLTAKFSNTEPTTELFRW